MELESRLPNLLYVSVCWGGWFSLIDWGVRTLFHKLSTGQPSASHKRARWTTRACSTRSSWRACWRVRGVWVLSWGFNTVRVRACVPSWRGKARSPGIPRKGRNEGKHIRRTISRMRGSPSCWVAVPSYFWGSRGRRSSLQLRCVFGRRAYPVLVRDGGSSRDR